MRERPPSGTKEDSIELSVVLEKHPYTFWDSKGGVAMGNVFDDLTVNVFCELHCSLRPARGTYPPAFTGERDKKRVLAAVAVYPSGTVSEDSAVKVLVEGF